MQTNHNSRSHKNTQTSIAVVGLGCHYPGARTPRELWENVLARRQQFRQFPDCRLPCSDYHDPDPNTPDKTYGRRAAVIDGFEFDWLKWRIPKATIEGTDIVQWLALQIASQALEDAGYHHGTVPRERTGVVLGNTLTGEHTRANTMRTRWPFVRRALLASAAIRGVSSRAAEEMAASMEELFKSVFPPVTEDTLAGGLSNTIAGRICNAFDFHGGGYVIDGACSSSLLAVCTAANSLVSGDLDLALAGGVDISLDTFELIGFAKTGALSPDEMRVYDRRGKGFIPGEGCGFVILKRLEDAQRDGDFIYATMHGWGISSDGKGGLTAPSVEGQARALRRAYQRAGYSAADLDFLEGHGTGTRVGDRVELEAIASVVGKAAPRKVGVTSFKSIVGHTKAAAGIGAFIKTAIALNRRVLPPTAGCSQLNDVFHSSAHSLYPILSGQVVEPHRKLRAGISAMGFGGINSHVTLESGDAPAEKLAPSIDEQALLASNQESELFVIDATSVDALRTRLQKLIELSAPLSQAELVDFAAHLWDELSEEHLRVAVVASSPDELVARFEEVHQMLSEQNELFANGGPVRDVRGNWWIGTDNETGPTAWLFPGQGSQQLQMARLIVERHAWARDLVLQADRWLEEIGNPAISTIVFRSPEQSADDEELNAWKKDLARTEIAQPAICLASLIYAQHLQRLGITPDIVLGHSLGELTAFCVAGAFDEEVLIKLAGLRGRLMAESAVGSGTMVSLACDVQKAQSLLRDVSGVAVVANLNSPSQTVISGDIQAMETVVQRARTTGLTAITLPVSGAFHSPLFNAAAERLRDQANLPETFTATETRVVSSMTGEPVAAGTSLADHFSRQIISPVDFIRTVKTMTMEATAAIEVGPGNVLSKLVGSNLNDNEVCLPVAGRANRDSDLHRVLARAFVSGASINSSELYAGRLVRECVPATERKFIENPCERPFSAELASTTEPLREALAPMELFDETGLSADALEGYLARRKGFLADVIKADIASLNGSLAKLPADNIFPKNSFPANSSQQSNETGKQNVFDEKQEPGAHSKASCESSQKLNLELTVMRLAADQTGFPIESLSPENRLLDDLNLDSIKAAELVSKAAKAAGVADRIDPSQYANASLSEIETVLAQLVACGDSTENAAELTSTSTEKFQSNQNQQSNAEPTWVRNFVVEYVDLSA